VVPEHLGLHLCELPWLGEHAGGKIHERPADSELVGDVRSLSGGVPLEEFPHQAAGALGHLGKQLRALRGIRGGRLGGHVPQACE
jgi:hypothetical protein